MINYGYNQDSLLTSADDLTLARDPQNGLLQGSSPDHITDTFVYNPFGEPEDYQASFNASSLFQQSFERDNYSDRERGGGRITRKTQTIQGVTQVYDYGYDLAGRLESVTVDGTLQSTYVYDSQDRLLSYGANTYAYSVNVLSKAAGCMCLIT